VAFSAAMHSFLAVDADGESLTGSWTWLDRRAADTAAQLRQAGVAKCLQDLTGVPIHPFSPLVKWCHSRGALAPGVRPVALKDYLFFRLTGRWWTDYSTAAASGFLGRQGTWAPDALRLAGLGPEALPVLHDVEDTLPDRLGQVEVVIGGTDAALQHLHFGIAPGSTTGVISFGTSAAIRVTGQESVSDDALFSYGLGPGRGHLVGAAFSNAGNLLLWLGTLLGNGVEAVVGEGLLSIRERRARPVVVPYWYGERTPWWREDLTGAVLGLRSEHEPRDLVAASLTAIAAGLRFGLARLGERGALVEEVIGASGLLRLPDVGQWLADALSCPVIIRDGPDASLLGAVDLALGGHVASDASEFRHEPEDSRVAEDAARDWARIEAYVAGSGGGRSANHPAHPV
jgi:gluconokinase